MNSGVVKIRAFEVLGSVEWQVLIDVSGQPIGPTFMGQAVDPCSRFIIIIIIIIIIFRKYVSNIPGNHEVKELQKTAILGTAHILRKVLM